MPPPSLARTYFEQIRSAASPTDFIQDLVNSATSESDWLDFKQPPSMDLKNPKWRELWVEALAGFANNQGGVLIWGIDARKDPMTQIDAACGVTPVNNPHGTKSRLIELQRQATDPPLANVKIEAYELPSAPGTGFVVCLIPEGPFKPYRTEEGRKSQYPFRAGDNFQILSRPMLQSLFYPRSIAVFEIEAELWWEPPANTEDKQCGTWLEVRVSNKGTATAKDLLLRVEGHNIQPAPNRRVSTGDGWLDELAYTSYRTRSLHPGLPPQTVFRWTWAAPTTMMYSNHSRLVPSYPDLEFRFGIYAENQQPQRFNVAFEMDQFIHAGRQLKVVSPEE
jgi:hypothetical protein